MSDTTVKTVGNPRVFIDISLETATQLHKELGELPGAGSTYDLYVKLGKVVQRA
jgi:hypothetical protein